MERLNQAHLLLAGSADTAQEFYQTAAQAIAIATGSRWGGVGFSKENSSKLEIVAFWERGKSIQSLSFDIEGSPCEWVYRTQNAEDFIHFPENLQAHFDSCQLLSDLNAQSYCGQAFYGENQQVVGHIFSLDDKPQAERPENRFFFGLLSQRMSAEYRRFNQQEELRRYSNMVTITRNMMSFVDTEYRYRAVSQGYVDTFGVPPELIIGKAVDEVHGQAVFNEVLKPVLSRSLEGEHVKTRHWIYPPGMKPRFLDVWQTPHFDEDGSVSGVVVSGHDITRQRIAEETLQKLSLAVTHSPVLTVITDPDGVIEYVSPIVEKITGYTPDEVIGNTPRLFKSGRTDNKIYEELWAAIKGKQAWSGELENRRKDGRYYWESISIAPVVNEDGRLVAFVGISMDITERKEMEQKLQELASSDPLTGIFNRRYFMDEFEHQLDHAKRYGMPLSLMIIDIDNFKQINDTGGHAMGDEAILQFVEVCKRTVRIVDIFGRMGGDEFAIAMPETDSKSAWVLAERLMELINRLTIRHEDDETGITVSIGLASCKIEQCDKESTQTILNRADKALYQAKRNGRNQIFIGD